MFLEEKKRKKVSKNWCWNSYQLLVMFFQVDTVSLSPQIEILPPGGRRETPKMQEGDELYKGQQAGEGICFSYGSN